VSEHLRKKIALRPACRDCGAFLLAFHPFIWYTNHLEGKSMTNELRREQETKSIAYSRLKRVLSELKITVPELHRRLAEKGLGVNLKSLYRLSNETSPVERLDLRVAGAICEVCSVKLSDLITFETGEENLRRLEAKKQKRLDELMALNNDGLLTPQEREELQALVREVEELSLQNARVLKRQRQLLERSQTSLEKWVRRGN
jgi:DNA-binding Xre family transcriptional regulator